MKGLDTNVLVRYLIQDDEEQSLLATRFIGSFPEFFINGIVLCELVWVLETAYDYPRQQIVSVLEKILRTRQFVIDNSQIVWQAWRGYKSEGADFADHYIAYLNAHKGCEFTVTFDKKAVKLSHFRSLT